MNPSRRQKYQLDALQVIIQYGSTSFPKSLRNAFIKNCVDALKDRFGCDYLLIDEQRFSEAVALIDGQIVQIRKLLDSI